MCFYFFQEMFGKSWMRIAQFIGTKTSYQVKAYAKANCVKNIPHLDEGVMKYNESARVFTSSEIIDDMQIPASMEEVIAVVTTAQPTITVTTSSKSEKKGLRLAQSQKAKSLQHKVRKIMKPKTQKSLLKRNIQLQKKGYNKEISETHNNAEMKPIADINYTLDLDVASTNSSTNLLHRANLLSNSQEVVRIKKVSEDSDDEIEVDDPDDMKQRTLLSIKKEDEKIDCDQDFFLTDACSPKKEVDNEETHIISLDNSENSGSDKYNENSDTMPEGEGDPCKDGKDKPSHHEILQLIYQLPPAKEECHLDPDVITDDETLIHSEFFEGRSTKTPKRYLKVSIFYLNLTIRLSHKQYFCSPVFACRYAQSF